MTEKNKNIIKSILYPIYILLAALLFIFLITCKPYVLAALAVIAFLVGMGVIHYNELEHQREVKEVSKLSLDERIEYYRKKYYK